MYIYIWQIYKLIFFYRSYMPFFSIMLCCGPKINTEQVKRGQRVNTISDYLLKNELRLS